MRVGIVVLDRREFDPDLDGVEGVEYKLKVELPEGSVVFKLSKIGDEWLIEV